MEKRSIQFSPPDISELEVQEVADALRSGWITTGPKTKELERRLAEYFHTEKAVCLNSATAAEELNFRILGIGEGDEVIVPSYTYTASASAAIHAGAKVVFADIQKDGDPVSQSPEMDYEAIASLITEKTKAVVPVDFGGIPCDYDRLSAVLEEKKSLFRPGSEIQEAIGRVAVVADSAHAVGASRKGKMCGEIADFTSFSFHAVKNLTTAEGGCSVWRKIKGFDSDRLYHQYQLLSLHGQSKDALTKSGRGTWEYDIVGPWYKCNMTDVAAALGLAQFERYPQLEARRREIAGIYDRMCDELGVFHLNHSGESYESSYHLYVVRIPGIGVRKRNEIIVRLAEEGISTNVHYKPLPMMTAYKKLGFDIEDFPNAYDYYRNLITLPLHTKLSDEDVEYIKYWFTKIVREYLG